jgi:hypothetical protein
MGIDFLKYFSYYSQKMMTSPYYFGPPVDRPCICQRYFKNFNGLKIHLSRIHPTTKVTPFKCFEENFEDVRLRISTNQVLKTAEVDIDTIVSSQDASLDTIPITCNNAANPNYGKDSQCLICFKFFRGTNALKTTLELCMVVI